MQRNLAIAEKLLTERRVWFGNSVYNEEVLGVFRTYFNDCEVGQDWKTPAMRLGLARGPRAAGQPGVSLRPRRCRSQLGRSSRQLQAHDSREDEADAGKPGNGGGFAEENYPENDRANRSDAGPDRVCGANRQSSHRQAEQPDADDHRRDRADSWPKPGESFGVL